MNNDNVNSIINNLCNKLGTTTNKLIPEMASYQIAKYSILMAVSIIFIGVCIGLTIRLLWMRKNDKKMLGLYPSMVRQLDEELKASGIMDELSPMSKDEWKSIIYDVGRVRGVLQWDEPTWIIMTMTAVWSGLIGMVMFGIALNHIIGWLIAPNASAFIWIIGQLGG